MLKAISKKKPSPTNEDVKENLIKNLDINDSFTKLDNKNKMMTKIEMLNKYFDSYEKKISSSDICNAVHSIFGFDLDAIPILYKVTEEQLKAHALTGYTTPLTRVVIDSLLNQLGRKATSADIRNIVNQIFGTNLDGISSLEEARISLFSKGHWISKGDKDLFVVYTGKGDIDVWIKPTKYFIGQTGLEELPTELQHSLTSIGFYYNKEIGSYYFSNPNGEAVPDAFKGKTIGAIKKISQNLYANL